jgi:hypothetical protein
MENPDKKPWRDIYKSPWYPRDGGPPVREIPEHIRKQILKERQRSGGGSYVLSRFVGIRGREYGFELLDYPDAGTVWLEFEGSPGS